MFKYIVCVIILFINTVAIAQDSEREKTSVHANGNYKPLFSCGLGDLENRSSKVLSTNFRAEEFLVSNNFTSIRKIRLAVVASGEYSQYHVKKENAEAFSEKEQKQIVLKAIKKSISNVNEVFKRDLLVELVLIENNEKLVFLDPKTDELNAKSALIFISEIAGKINSLIGEQHYDIGHGFMGARGGLSFVGGAFGSRKAQGVTGAKVPEGKIFDIDILAHEIGHQLGATHTQNSDCVRNPISSVEVGSGSTIMGYAGVCDIPNSNTSLSSLPYFHDINILQVDDFLKRHFQKENKRNQADYGLEEVSNYDIPLDTPFKIELKTNIEDNKRVFFSCSQIDAEVGIFPPTSHQVLGPVFSTQELSLEPYFYFPELETILDGTVNSMKGVLSKVPRSYNFLASARGNVEGGNMISMQKFKVNVVDVAPFEVISQNKPEIVWGANSEQTIVWEVGGSKTVLRQDFVQILLSDNNGESFDYVLSEKTPNDGKESIRVPSGILSDKCRIKIRPTNSIFYAVNKKRFSINNFEAKTAKELVNVFPNPVKDVLNIQFQKTEQLNNMLEVFSISGDFEKSFVLNEEALQKVSIGDLTSGVHFLRITTSNGITNKKIVIE